MLLWAKLPPFIAESAIVTVNVLLSRFGVKRIAVFSQLYFLGVSKAAVDLIFEIKDKGIGRSLYIRRKHRDASKQPT